MRYLLAIAVVMALGAYLVLVSVSQAGNPRAGDPMSMEEFRDVLRQIESDYVE